MKYTQIFAITLSALAISCGSPSDSGSSASPETTTSVTETASGNDEVISAYMELKDALVDTDYNTARQKVDQLNEAIKTAGIDSELKISETMTSAGDIETIRAAFYPVSKDMYNWIKSVDTGDLTLYWQYCPMAMGNTGAHWLSLESEVMNPYFGDVMLRCGNVEEQL